MINFCLKRKCRKSCSCGLDRDLGYDLPAGVSMYILKWRVNVAKVDVNIAVPERKGNPRSTWFWHSLSNSFFLFFLIFWAVSSMRKAQL